MRVDIKASDFGIRSGNDITKELQKLLDYVKTLDGEKHIYLDKGYYVVSSAFASEYNQFLSNTLSIEEMEETQTYEQRKYGILINGLNDVIFHGNGSSIINNSYISTLCITNSSNIIIDNLNFFYKNPHIHKFTVLQIGWGFADFLLTKSSDYMCRNGIYYLVGDGYKLGFLDNKDDADWLKKVAINESNSIKNSDHPFAGADYIQEIRNRRFRVYGKLSKKIKLNDEYYIVPKERSNVTIFIDDSKDISLTHISILSSNSHGVLAQNSENLYFSHLKIAPPKSMRLTTIGDGMHFNLCRGDITVKDSIIKGATRGLNISSTTFGIHQVTKRLNSVIVSYNGEYTFGFNPFKVGDSIEFIDKNTFQTIQINKVLATRKLTEHSIELALKDDIKCDEQAFVNNISAMPICFLFKNNYVDDISNDAIRCLCPISIVDNNVFNDIDCNGVVVDGDLNNEYEAVKLKSFKVCNNKFARTTGYDILISPKFLSKNKKIYLHENVNILNNDFMKYSSKHIKITNCENVRIKNNTIRHSIARSGGIKVTNSRLVKIKSR